MAINGDRLEALFPSLRGTRYLITSSADERYNCIAWAAGATNRWWWPGDPATTYWPAGVPRAETPYAFREAFASLGYDPCNSPDVEPGFEKIAIFAGSDGIPTHAARQLPTGRWTSKLGRLEDLEHALNDIAGTAYGAVILIMRRSDPEARSDAIQSQALL